VYGRVFPLVILGEMNRENKDFERREGENVFSFPAYLEEKVKVKRIFCRFQGHKMPGNCTAKSDRPIQYIFR